MTRPARLLQFRSLTLALLVSLVTSLVLPTTLIADTAKSYLEVSPHDQDDLRALFETIEQSEPEFATPENPIVIILHGEEASSFTRKNYLENKPLVDRAALLDAYRMIDIRMCETWMNENGISRSDLPPFIDVIPYAPEEVEKLEQEGFVPYKPVRL